MLAHVRIEQRLQFSSSIPNAVKVAGGRLELAPAKRANRNARRRANMLHDPHRALGTTNLPSLLSSGIHRSRSLDPFDVNHFNLALEYFANAPGRSTTPGTSQCHRTDRDKRRKLFHQRSMTQQ